MQVLLCITNNSMKHRSFIYTQLNDSTVLFQIIQFNKSHLFARSLNASFDLTNRWYPTKCYHSGSEWTWELWQWRGTSHSPKLEPYWSLTIRLFSPIDRALVGWSGVIPLPRRSWCILLPTRLLCIYVFVNSVSISRLFENISYQV